MSAQWVALSLVYAVTAGIAVVVAVLVVRRRRSAPTVAPWVALTMAGITWWALAEFFMRMAFQPAGRTAATVVFSVAPPLVSVGYAFSARAIVDSSYRPNAFVRGAALGFPAVVALLVAIVPSRAFFAGHVVHDGFVLRWTPGPGFWLVSVICGALMAGAMALEVRALRHAAETHRDLLLTHLVGGVLPVLGSVGTICIALQAGGAVHTDTIDLATLGLALTALVNCWALLQQGFLSVVPVARGLVLQELGEAVFIFDARGHLVDRNTAADNLVAACGFRPANLNSAYRFQDILSRLGPGVRAKNGEYQLASVPPRDIDLRVSEVLSHGRLYGTSLVIRDVTGLNESRREVAAANERLRLQLETIEALRTALQEQADLDALTGLSNRRRFEEILSATFEHARRTASPFSVLVIDLDHFKAVNDRFGHLVGDEVLIDVAGGIRAARTGAEHAFRFGGEEFVVLLPGVARPGAFVRGQEYAHACRRTPGEAAHGVPVTTSIGVATYPDDGADPMAVLRAADNALYRAKGLGRDRVEAATSVHLMPVRTPKPAGLA